jgi:hypothetical protein
MTDQKEKDLIEAILELALDGQRIATRKALAELDSLKRTPAVKNLRKKLLKADRKIETQLGLLLEANNQIKKMTTQN